MTDLNKVKNEQILASFKSKILQQMNDKLRHTTTDLGNGFSGQLELASNDY